MKRFIKISAVFFHFLSFGLPIFAQNSSGNVDIIQHSFYNSIEKISYSELIEDTFLISISLPDNYLMTEKKYPVLYVLDGDVAFGMATSIARYLQIGDNIPELIVVGIGYGGVDNESGEKRRRDYRPGQSGGAKNFLDYLNDQLIPLIDSEYRTIPGERIITGYSIGGLFALYTLFVKPDSFNRYIVGSPYLTWDNSSIFNYEANSFEEIDEMNLSLFISVGSEESDDKYFNPIDNLVTKIQERNYSKLKLTTKVFDGSTHLVGPPESLAHGLISVFN